MVIDDSLIDQLKDRANESPRLRMNYILHKDANSNAQKMLNYFCPNTIVPIHRHQLKNETYILITGQIDVIFTDDIGKEQYRYVLNHAKGIYGIDIPAGQWHTIEVNEPSLIFECSDGPYIPLSDSDIIK